MIDFIIKNAAIIGLLFFFTLFCGIVIYVLFVPGGKKKFNNYAKIPFKDQDDSE